MASVTPEQQTAVIEWLAEQGGFDTHMLIRGLPALGGRSMRQAVADGDVAMVLRTIQPEVVAWCNCDETDDSHDCEDFGCTMDVEVPRYELLAYPLAPGAEHA